jgi:hypothetical protein
LLASPDFGISGIRPLRQNRSATSPPLIGIVDLLCNFHVSVISTRRLWILHFSRPRARL